MKIGALIHSRGRRRHDCAGGWRGHLLDGQAVGHINKFPDFYLASGRLEQRLPVTSVLPESCTVHFWSAVRKCRLMMTKSECVKFQTTTPYCYLYCTGNLRLGSVLWLSFALVHTLCGNLCPKIGRRSTVSCYR